MSAFQVDALVADRAARVVTAIPDVDGGRILDPANASGSARVGFYAGRGRLAPGSAIAEILVTPERTGRLPLRLAQPLVPIGPGVGCSCGSRSRRSPCRSGRATARCLRRWRSPVAAPPCARVSHAFARLTHGDVGAAYEAWQLGAASVQVLQQAGRHEAAPPTPAPPSSGPHTYRAGAAAALPTVWVVNTTDDLPDAAPGDRICVTAAGTCTLRAAIDEAERRKGDDVINFNIPGGAPQIIQLTLDAHRPQRPVDARRPATPDHRRLQRARRPPEHRSGRRATRSRASPSAASAPRSAARRTRSTSRSANTSCEASPSPNRGRDVNIFGATRPATARRRLLRHRRLGQRSAGTAATPA